MHDEGPSPEDLDRFGADTAYCPHCGAEIWDQAPVCSACHEPLHEGTIGRAPIDHELRRRMIVIIVVLVLLAFLLVYAVR